MSAFIDDIVSDERARRREFPVADHRVFMAHAGVAPLPAAAVEAIREFTRQASRDHQESGFIGPAVESVRETAAKLLGCSAGEIALLGPTSLGLSLVANGLSWRPDDEVVYYHQDYPANVYPWSNLAGRGVKPVALKPERPGEITLELVEKALTDRTRLVALATCHFLSGFRIDVEEIGRRLAERGVLFCLDGIQSLGAFPISTEHVDFLSADSHKWLLGPMGAGIFFVKRSRFGELAPTLLGSWNVESPDFVAQERIAFRDDARRYEPGALNVPGILGMGSSMELLLRAGITDVAERILFLRERILELVRPLGYELYGEEDGQEEEGSAGRGSGILSLRRPGKSMADVFGRLAREGISVSLRRTGQGEALLRISPHFYNTEEEIERLAAVLAD
jgi:cysteine desulfurase/selenocysteine lyase